MSRYRHVETRIWEDGTLTGLSTEAKLLYLYHLTSPRSTPFGLYVEGDGSLADGLAMPSGRHTAWLPQAKNELVAKGLIWYSEDGANMVFDPHCFPRVSTPQSPNSVKSWLGILSDLPKTPFFFKCLRHWSCQAEGMHHAMTHAFAKQCRIQDQDQEQILKDTVGFAENREKNADEKKTAKANLRPQALEVLDFLNAKANRRYRPCRANIDMIVARLGEGATVMDLRKVVAKKCREWLHDERMTLYLRPATLFGRQKCAQYLGEIVPAEERTSDE